jgi:hypothetical protein
MGMPLSPPSAERGGEGAHFLPKFAFWTSTSSVRIVRPENWPETKWMGLPIEFKTCLRASEADTEAKDMQAI